MSKTEILGVGIDSIDYPNTVSRVENMIQEGGFHQIVTINPEFITHAQKDRQFKEILNRADLAVADGAGLILASKILGRPLASRVTGTDLIEKLCATGEKKGWRFFFLGGKKGAGEASSKMLRIRYPELQVVGVFEGVGEASGDVDTLAAIKDAGPIDILLVAFGHPKQEKWLARNRSQINVKVGIGVGGAFDFLSGQKRRAPKFMRQKGMEWLYRLITQPWRWRRQLSLPQFLYLVLKDKFKTN